MTTTARSRSVRTRIVWTTAVITVASMAVMIVVVVLIVGRLTTGRIDTSLGDRLAAAEAATIRQPDGSLKVTNARTNDVIDSVWVFDDDGTEVTGPEAGQNIRTTVDGLATVTRRTRLEQSDRVFLAEPIRLPGERRAQGVAVAELSLKPFESTRLILIGGLVALGVLAALSTAGLAAWTVRRTLRPVEQMTELASVWSERDLDSRFRIGPGTDEFARLANTLDGLLDRVAASIRSEQQLTGELAHELRTPLTTIRAEAELGLMSDADAAVHERLGRVVVEVDRLTSTITTLLALARHQHAPAGGSDVEAVVGALVETATRSSPGIALSAQVVGDTSSTRVQGNAELVERVLAPVLDNARRYAVSFVRVEMERAADDVLVRVTDDGPGIALDEGDIFLAGVGDPESDGAGLGLPLARKVATRLGGSVSVSSAQDPTVFEIRLPAA